MSLIRVLGLIALALLMTAPAAAKPGAAKKKVAAKAAATETSAPKAEAAESGGADKLELARRFLTATRAAPTAEQTVEMMLGSVAATGEEGPSPELASEMVKTLDPEGLMEQLLPIYAEVYEAETLQAAIDFFESPAGVRFLDGQARAVERANPISMKWSMDRMPQLIELMEAAGVGDE